MLAFRTTWIVKPRCMAKALEFFEGKYEATPGRVNVRVYTPGYSPNVLVYEETWETQEGHEKWWDEFNAAAESAALWDEWYALVKKPVGTELWNVKEWR